MASMMRRRRNRLDDDRGSELIELAIVLPILLIICAAIMDFGMLFQRYEVVTNAAREGARLASLPGGYTPTDIQNRVNDYLTSSGLDPAPTPPVVTYSNVVVGGTGPTVSMVSVLVAYPSEFTFLGSLAGLVGGGGWTTITLQASSQMRVEVPGTGS
jgi:Flp pilus assembly protein TadG